MAQIDYFSAALGAMTGCIGLLVLLSLLVGKAYNERSLYALALMGALSLAHLVLGSTNMLHAQDTNFMRWLSTLFYTTALAVSILLPLLVLGQSGGSKRPAQLLVCLSASSVPVSMALNYDWGLACAAVYTCVWVVYGVWYFQRNWQQGRPWVVWLVAGQLMLWFAWVGKFATDLGILAFDASTLLAWSALNLMLFTVASYLALVWRSRLLSLERLKSQEVLTHDPLTGLSLRSEFVSALDRVSNRSETLSYTSGILVLRAKNLSEFSQSMGADNNELGLLWVARILRRCTRTHDMVARISDHHFAALIDGVELGMDINSLATKIVSHGLRLQMANPEGQSLQFNIVAMPIAGKALQPNLVIADLLQKLEMSKDSDKAIHLIQPSSAFNNRTGKAR
jgi:GGDEF domain-containing protein